MLDRALTFAKQAHGDQVRKYTGEPYVSHLIEVAQKVDDHGGDIVMQTAAILHDVVEDTPVTIQQVHDAFGKAVSDLVYWLTDVSKPQDGNRAFRKAMDADHLAKAPRDAQFIKLADLISNSRSIIEHDPSFAKVYVKEKQHLLSVMTKVQDTKLYAIAKKIVEEYQDVPKL